ncbi:MAG: proton-conducting transporter membrane subunit [Bacteroidales bacterium]
MLLISFIAGTGILFAASRYKGIIAFMAVIANSVISSIPSVQALAGHPFNQVLTGTIPFGEVLIRIDALSAWFILTINFTLVTGTLYGISYMRQYREQKANLSLHWVAVILVHVALLGICSVQNGMAFLLCWEMMALSAFILVIFEHYKKETMQAGINYLIQSHIAVVFLMLAIIYVAFKTGRYDFTAITEFAIQEPQIASIILFLFFFVGFAIKAGFVPFHTWLPWAHPAAPSHVSGMMSGVIIKIGIYGILRMILLVKTDYAAIGYFILFISIITGVYGVMLAIIQHDLKRLLAYHSIENIGIIGIGIGIGCIGLGNTNKWMAILGFMGALLHTLNHSLFKSLLFYSSGNIKQVLHSLHIDQLGGVMRKMPRTGLLFLLAAIAICGLPPLNGFISEFIIYGGIYNWLYSAGIVSLIVLMFSLLGLVMIGGLALLCFTKAFSIVFLGTPRQLDMEKCQEVKFIQLLPMYAVSVFILFIGLFPSVFLNILDSPVRLFTDGMVFNLGLIRVGVLDSLQVITRASAAFLLLVAALALIRRAVNHRHKTAMGVTWGCGYPASGSNLQYTASSFVRSYAKLAKPILHITKRDTEISEFFPEDKEYATEPSDKIETNFIDRIPRMIDRISNRFLFIHSGHLQRYILYGISFIACIVCIPYLIDLIYTITHFIKNF